MMEFTKYKPELLDSAWSGKRYAAMAIAPKGAWYHYKEVDAALAKLEAQNKKLQRSFWMACAKALDCLVVENYLMDHPHSRFWANGRRSLGEACDVMQGAVNEILDMLKAKAKEFV